MTDAPFTETHRETQELIERLRRDASQIAFEMHPETYPGAVRDVLNQAADALDAALAEIDRLTRRAECDGWRIEDAKAEIDRLRAQNEKLEAAWDGEEAR